MKALVIGGAGYIGGLTVDTLLQNGINVTVYDNLLYESRFLKNVNFIKGDIRDSKAIAAISEDYDVLILMAAIVGDAACAIDVDLTQEINCTSIQRICESVGLSKHIIYMSTCSVYGAQNDTLDENSPTNPLSEYARTKLKAEEYIRNRGGTIFRLGTVFGLGDSYSRIRSDLVVNTLTIKALQKGRISINGGEQWRPIISVTDIANYVNEACFKKQNGTYILCKDNFTIKHLGEKVAEAVPDTEIEFNEMLFEDARNYKVDNALSLEAFDYKPKVTVDQEIDKMVKVFSSGRIKDLNEAVYHNAEYLKSIKEYL
jgi:nucleoside-diphosphate-sugar epimerase